MSNFFATSNCARPRDLEHILVSEGESDFNGERVCHMFLKKRFGSVQTYIAQ